MLSDFETAKNYSVRRLLPEQDWEIFRDHLKRTQGENNYTWVLENEDFEDADMWKSEMRRFIQFGLFYSGELIGSTELYFRFDEDGNQKDVVFTGSIIEKDHRKLGLADYLYEARLAHMRSEEYSGKIVMEVMDSNNASLKAARRNGFVDAGEVIHSGERYYARYIVLAREP